MTDYNIFVFSQKLKFRLNQHKFLTAAPWIVNAKIGASPHGVDNIFYLNY